MHGPAMSGWLLVALCGVTSAYCLLWMRSGPVEERGTARGEALMGFGMAVMAVPAAVFAPPAWSWAVYAAVFGAAALRAVWRTRGGLRHTPHLHHLIGSAAMVYMALAMAPGVTGSPGHAGHGATSAGGVPLLTGALLAYYAVYVLRVGARLVPVVTVTSATGSGPAASAGALYWGARPELALACRLSMALAMLTMLLSL
ncbi:DUF5134 domain-containing protein [Streptomyces candidus]|uniref:DUF5134 domain-containing protein n=1 Tax=Streptomyces candidus TaxID=67283 RepID=A0A7X0HHP3_9ACTN|nr:DUF5134 domain-containing protein [Streptomyces candidus]MBB6437841.1 hypothetical protein [Streptomyces candidus]GHH50023.1 DUF5134 domain-containing protein [Streptomyces candidus]